MDEQRQSLQPVKGADRQVRRRIGLSGELMLAVLPTVTVLGVLGLVEIFGRQRLLFASLASSAFLIYLDPQHGTNTIRTLVLAHVIAAGSGLLTYLLFGHGYLAGGSAMVITIVLTLLLDAVHPPAISTSLTFAFRVGEERTIILFGLALGLILILVLLERITLRLLAWMTHR